MCFVRSDPSLLYLWTHDESIPEFDETNSALDESKRSDAWWVGLTNRRDELDGDKSDHDETIWGVDETNSSATRRIGQRRDDLEVDETNSVHNETNRNNDSTTRNANLVSDLTSYICLFFRTSTCANVSHEKRLDFYANEHTGDIYFHTNSFAQRLVLPEGKK